VGVTYVSNAQVWAKQRNAECTRCARVPAAHAKEARPVVLHRIVDLVDRGLKVFFVDEPTELGWKVVVVGSRNARHKPHLRRIEPHRVMLGHNIGRLDVANRKTLGEQDWSAARVRRGRRVGARGDHGSREGSLASSSVERRSSLAAASVEWI
jgi:hypothetical protein